MGTFDEHRSDRVPSSLRRTYRYVGDDASTDAAPPGTPIGRIDELHAFLTEHADDMDEPFTFVVVDGILICAPRRSEHVDCAGHRRVEAAGEIAFTTDADGWRVSELTNQSTGYCPEPSSFTAVDAALSAIGVDHPAWWTAAFDFRRCPGCGERNLVKDAHFACAACDTPLPSTWNIDDDADKAT